MGGAKTRFAMILDLAQWFSAAYGPGAPKPQAPGFVAENGVLYAGIVGSLLGFSVLFFACDRIAGTWRPAARMAGSLLMGGTAAAWLFAASPGRFEAIGLRPLTADTLIAASLAAALALSVQPLVRHLHRALGVASLAGANVRGRGSRWNPAQAGAGLVVGLVEEFVYRGCAIGLGQRLCASLLLAGALSLTLYTFSPPDAASGQTLPRFFSGLAFTVVFVLTGNLTGCMLARLALEGATLALVRRRLKRGLRVEAVLTAAA